jgi:HAD superfamily hydrolase (TIGR01509 family)
VLEAIIFDFDGVLVDTESAEFEAWSEIFRARNCELTIDVWQHAIGTRDGYDPLDDLEQRTGESFDREEVQRAAATRVRELLAATTLSQGVDPLILEARAAGIATAIASSSSHEWVSGFLERFDIAGSFDAISCWEPGRAAKPAPDLYLRALEALDVDARGTIAIEDSPNGLIAAKAAGLVCVLVPCRITSELRFDEPDLRVDSLADLDIARLASLVSGSSQARATRG